MRLRVGVLPILLLAGPAGALRSDEPLVCRVDTLGARQRDRYDLLTGRLGEAVVERIPREDGYTLVLDLSRPPRDAAGSPFSVVELAEWVDLEARCCPFLDFGIDVSGKGGLVRLRLTGGPNVKAFLETEFSRRAPGP